MRVLGRIVLRLQFLGSDNFPAKGAALVCSNHQSYLDPILAGAMCDRRLNYLARESLFRSRLFGGLMRFYDAIPVRRDGMSIAGLKETLRRLKREELVLIFPEGTRTEDGAIQPLKPGFIVLARKAKVPIVPLAIAGAFDVWPKGAKLPRPARVCMAVGRPISATQISSMEDADVLDMLDERIRECFRTASARNASTVANRQRIAT